MIKTYRTLSVLAIVLVFTFAGVSAQQISGTIIGVVQDETGGVLPGVEVTSRNTGTEATRTVVSDDEGRYRISQLAPGSYELRAELAGFQTAVLQGIELSMAQEAVVGVTLRVGSITEQVVVSAEVALVETTSGTVAALVDSQQVRDLPLNGRDFIQLALLQEGVLAPVAQRRSVNGDLGIKISIGGARPYDNAILLDGTDIKNQYGTTPGSVAGGLLGVDTVREFRVITSAYSAEYGRFTGGVINIATKSGTNEFHGSVFEYHRNAVLDARNFFDRDVEFVGSGLVEPGPMTTPFFWMGRTSRISMGPHRDRLPADYWVWTRCANFALSPVPTAPSTGDLREASSTSPPNPEPTNSTVQSLNITATAPWMPGISLIAIRRIPWFGIRFRPSSATSLGSPWEALL